jgi:hypothetical protein
MSRTQARPQPKNRHQTRKQELMNSFVDALFNDAKISWKEMDQNKWAYNRIAAFSLPGSGAQTTMTYWTDPSDPQQGVPIVLLLQGERDRETGELHPERLPGGKTAIQLLDDRLNEVDAPAGVQLLFEKSTKELHVYIVDLDRMDEWTTFIQSASQKPKERVAQAQERREPVVDEDGFQLVEAPRRK